MAVPRKPLSDEEKVSLKKLLHSLEQFRLLHPTMPLHHVVAMLRVAIDEGKNVGEYAEDSGLSHSSMSRHLLDIGSVQREGKPGLGLVQLDPSPEDLRTHAAMLTPKGLQLARSVIRILNSGK
jgi:DNA-binding MarR family transcriptional regulator